MSGANGGEDGSKQAAPNGFTSWRAYWTAQGLEWRTQPEIDDERQHVLHARRHTRGKVETGRFAFSGEVLSRADVEWLLATHESRGIRGPVDWADPRQRTRRGLDLRGANLTKADLRGLPLARLVGGFDGTHRAAEDRPDGAVNLERANLSAAHLEGAYLYGVNLRRARLDEAYLTCADLGAAQLARASFDAAHVECADLSKADLEGARLYKGCFDGANLGRANLNGANFNKASFVGANLWRTRATNTNLRTVHLEGAFLYGARLEEAFLHEVHFEGTAPEPTLVDRMLATVPTEHIARVQRWSPGFPKEVGPADLRRSYFDSTTNIEETTLGEPRRGFIALADVRWNGANITALDWASCTTLGDEQYARRQARSQNWTFGSVQNVKNFRAAARAYAQIATELRNQGASIEANRMAYRGQLLLRQVTLRQGYWLRWFGSWLLDLISGYGYKPLRSLTAYVVIIGLFAGAYLLNAQFAAPHLTWDEALVLSISSFHGRGFFSSGISLGDTLARLAAGEAILGLLIEITFIATFTQRFFAR